MDLIARRGAFAPFGDEIFIKTRGGLMKNKDRYHEDTRFAMRILQEIYSRIYNNENGDINAKKEIKEINRIYFYTRTKKDFDRLVSLGKNKGFYKTILGISKDQVLSDYRLFIHYILTMTCWMRQRSHFLRKFCKENNIDDMKIPSVSIPSAQFFRDYGENYWSIVCADAINQTNREILLLRNRSENIDVTKNITAFINDSGEVYYGLNKAVEIKMVAQMNAAERLRNRRVVE